MKKIVLLLFLAISGAAIGLAQVPAPQINLSGTIGTQGSPTLNNGTIQFASDANHTMTPAESSAVGGLTVTTATAWTTTRSLVIPSTFGNISILSIENVAANGYPLNVCVGTGTTCGGGLSITIPAGQVAAGVRFNGTNVTAGGGGGGSISGMTAGQIPVAATASTVTSSIPLAGAGAAIATGPTSTTSGDLTQYSTSGGQQSDSGITAAHVLQTTTPAASFPTLNQNTSGNAATATALAGTPSQCPSGPSTGISANGNANCMTNTGNGNNVLQTSPTLVTPNLGTPSAAVLTNATGLPLSTGVTGVLTPSNGGTGTSTIPTAGQVPFGQTGGMYSPTTLTPAIIGASAAPTFPVTPMANYELAAGQTGNTSTTAVDTTGNGNTLTFGSGGRAPTWAANGISLAINQGADFPSAVNSALTWCGYGLYTPLGLTAFNQSGGYPSIIASSLGSATNAQTITLGYNGQFWNQPNGGLGDSPGPGLVAFGGYTSTSKTNTNQTISGEVAWCYVEGETSNSTLDTVYLNNGIETYATQGAIGGIQTTGNLSLCASTSTFTAGCANTIQQGLTAFSQQLTSSQVQQVFAVYSNDATNHGITFTPTPQSQTAPHLYGVGNSIMLGANGGNTAWLTTLSLTNQPAYTIVNYGISGVTLLAEAAAEPWRLGTFCGNQQNPNVILFEGATNDIATFPNVTAQQIWGLTTATAKKYKQAGCVVGYTPVISRSTTTVPSGGAFETFRATYNNIARSLWPTAFDFIFDWAANPYLGATYASNNGSSSTTCAGASTYFNADCIHPTPAGDTLISTVTSNSLNYYFASNTAGNPLVLTATQTITLASGNRFVDASACTACTITLPDGVGPTGGTYNITVGTGAATVQGQTLYGSAQTVNGSSSAVTLPTSHTTTLTIVALPQATAGIKWVF